MRKGRITISRTTSNVRDTYVTISLRGMTGALPLLQIEMTMEEFGNAISGLGYVSCEYSQPKIDQASLADSES